MKRELGFTLLELMVVVAIVAIIAAIAFPLYTESVHKSHRSEAYQILNDLTLKEEKYRSNNATYGTCDLALNPDTCSGVNGRTSYYNLAITGTPDGTTYTATATPKGAQANDRCGKYTYSMSLGTMSKTAASGQSNCL